MGSAFFFFFFGQVQDENDKVRWFQVDLFGEDFQVDYIYNMFPDGLVETSKQFIMRFLEQESPRCCCL